jgi:hypothetical protein
MSNANLIYLDKFIEQKFGSKRVKERLTGEVLKKDTKRISTLMATKFYRYFHNVVINSLIRQTLLHCHQASQGWNQLMLILTDLPIMN